MSRHIFKWRHWLAFWILVVLAGPFCIETTYADMDIIERDTDKDGKIDQIAHLDKHGKLIDLEIDKDADGVMDQFQHYKDEQITCVERDTNGDQQIDIREYFESGKRVRQERISASSGKVNQIKAGKKRNGSETGTVMIVNLAR